MIEAFAKEAREALNAMVEGGGVSVEPRSFTLLFLLSVSIPALSYSSCLLVSSIVSSLGLLAYAAYRGARLRHIGYAVLYPSALAAAASIPLLFYGRIVDAALLAYHSVTPALIAAAATALAGWRTIVEGLAGLGAPRILVEPLLNLGYVLEALIRRMLVLLAAREARTLASRGSVLRYWRLQASALASLLASLAPRLWNLSRAVEARTIGGFLPSRLARVSARYASSRRRVDYLLYALLALVVVGWVMGEAGVIC